MKIRKVDDKPMVIHTKEKAKIHAHEPKGAKIKGSNIYTVERGPKTAGAKVTDTDRKKSYRKSTIHQSEPKNKGLSRFKQNLKESNTSIKTKNTNLHIAGRTGALVAGAVTDQVEGGQEVSQAAYLAYEAMPRYRSNERDESNGVIYKDVCNPITAEFREELYTNILDAYARIREPEKEETQKRDRIQEMPEFSVTVTPYEREGSNIKGLARIYFENSFIVNNINIVQGKEKIFVSMPSYKTKQVDEQGKPIYQDVCYPVTKDFREKLYNEIISEYEKAKDKSNEKARESAEKHHGNPDKEKDKEATPFR